MIDDGDMDKEVFDVFLMLEDAGGPSDDFRRRTL